MQDKANLRSTLLAHRQAIPAEVRAEWDAVIGARVLAWLATHSVQTLGIYWPMRGEPDLRETYRELARSGVQLALPMVEVRDAPLRFAAWTPDEPLVKDALGVLVPADGRHVIKPEALLIPCVGFNSNNFRLGYGGGFYDRTLASHPRPFAIGIAYASLFADFEAAPHDIPLNLVITEQAGAAY
ncbi:5-formyltetrahydrofolate cyclo-ligase [Noviherbaspirillum massiliense]|uniref:5-formyltetrahydrofolate cyclo-ligase n=1 Tax=Noviherbaspirillum massiliense TaxID=1465823 RepID=UPI0002E86CC2|nr:5-formyltetrahydrofolate cyclo-ligase [Noviherbaspirillum massiliense]